MQEIFKYNTNEFYIKKENNKLELLLKYSTFEELINKITVLEYLLFFNESIPYKKVSKIIFENESGIFYFEKISLTEEFIINSIPNLKSLLNVLVLYKNFEIILNKECEYFYYVVNS